MKKNIVFPIALLLFLSAAVSARASDYVIGKGDILVIQVWGEDYLTSEVKVRPDGKISLLGVNDLQAEGLTPMQLQRRIAGRLSALVNDPMVSVMVHASSNHSVIVHGPGVKSAVVALEGGTTLLAVLSKLGPDFSADLDAATVSRGNQVLVSGLRDLYERGDMSKNIELMGGDRIYMPLRQARFVYVDGAVTKPSSLPFYEGMTVLEAIHQAGGFTKFADRNDTVIVRRTENGASQSIAVRGKDLTEKGDLAQNVLLKAGDLILAKKSWF